MKQLMEMILYRANRKKLIVKKVNPKNINAAIPEIIVPTIETFFMFMFNNLFMISKCKKNINSSIAFSV